MHNEQWNLQDSQQQHFNAETSPLGLFTSQRLYDNDLLTNSLIILTKRDFQQLPLSDKKIHIGSTSKSLF